MSRTNNVPVLLFLFCLAAPAGLSAQEYSYGKYPQPSGNGPPASKTVSTKITPLDRKNTGTVELSFPRCEIEGHTHKHGVLTGAATYNRYRVRVDSSETKGIARPFGRFKADRTDPSGGEVLDEDGTPHDANALFEDYEERSDGLKRTNGTSADLVTVGLYHIRVYQTNILTKGWFGSDEYDELDHSLRTVRSVAREIDQWKTGSHTGTATLAGNHYVETKFILIGGVSDWLEWVPWVDSYRATIHPRLTSYAKIINVGGSKSQEGTLTTRYKQNVDPSRKPFLNVSGKARWEGNIGPVGTAIEVANNPAPRPRVPAEENIVLEDDGNGEKPSLLYLNPVTDDFPWQINASGPAKSVATNYWYNQLGLSIQTNDMLATWEFRMTADSELYISECSTASPVPAP